MLFDKNRNSHEQDEVTIKVNDNEYETFKCDHLLAPLITRLNQEKLWTEFCCSGHEEDAFGTFYIAFMAGSNKMNKQIRNLVSSTGKAYFKCETCFRINPTSNRGKHYAQLYDPTIPELIAGITMCFGFDVNIDDVFDVDNNGHIIVCPEYALDLEEYIVIRPAFFEKFKKETAPLDKEQLEEYISEHTKRNFGIITKGIERMCTLIDLYK